MGVSAVGAGPNAASIRHAIATLLVAVGLLAFFYGPPLTEKLSEAAHRECNKLTGSSYRHYRLEWRTTTYSSIHAPQWVCYDLRNPREPGTELGWWVDL